jgi:hypothetical protein
MSMLLHQCHTMDVTCGAMLTSVTAATAGAAALPPDTMKTNIPFQAPGSNAAPRGAAQQQGTTAVRALKNACKQIK